jgi:hypothetical protein
MGVEKKALACLFVYSWCDGHGKFLPGRESLFETWEINPSETSVVRAPSAGKHERDEVPQGRRHVMAFLASLLPCPRSTLAGCTSARLSILAHDHPPIHSERERLLLKLLPMSVCLFVCLLFLISCYDGPSSDFIESSCFFPIRVGKEKRN